MSTFERAELSSLSCNLDISLTPCEAPEEPQMSPEVERMLQDLLDKEPVEKLESKGKFSRAKWKIQLWFKSDRSVQKPITFTLSFWESGKRMHGGGDESAFICKHNPKTMPKLQKPPFVAIGGESPFKKKAAPEGCGSIIPGDMASGDILICPSCGIKWDRDNVADSVMYTLPVEQACVVLADWFRKLDSNCDLYLKYRPEDVRTLMMAQNFGLHEAIRHKGLLIYPLAHIIKDISGGAELEKRFKTLLLA